MKKIVLFLFFISIAVFSNDWHSAKVPNGYAKGKNDPKEIEISIIDDESAKKLFSKMKQNRDLSFVYPRDGCYARTTAMTNIAENEKVIMGRVNVEGDLYVNLSIKEYPSASWGWHVAPFVLVKKNNDKIIKMVFDPLLFEEPVELSVWQKKMLGKTSKFTPRIKKIYFGNRFQYFKNRIEKCIRDCRFNEEYRSEPFTEEELGNYAVTVKLKELKALQNNDISNTEPKNDRKTTKANP